MVQDIIDRIYDEDDSGDDSSFEKDPVYENGTFEKPPLNGGGINNPALVTPSDDGINCLGIYSVVS